MAKKERLRLPTNFNDGWRSVDFQVTIRSKFLKPSLTHVWHRSKAFKIWLMVFCCLSFFFYFEIMKYFRSPDTSQLKSFLILGNFSYHHSKKNILLFIWLSQKSPVTITSAKFMFSVKQIEIKKCAFFCFSLKCRKQNILTHWKAGEYHQI